MRRVFRSLPLAVLLATPAAFAAPPAHSNAGGMPECSASLDDATTEVADLQAELSAARATLADVQAELADAQAELELANSEVELGFEEVAQLQQTVDSARVTLTEATTLLQVVDEGITNDPTAPIETFAADIRTAYHICAENELSGGALSAQ
jgi:chromosome segregation ATPase